MRASAADFCPRCATPVEVADLRCCICALVLPPADAGGGEAPALQLVPAGQILRCQECAAAVAYAAEHQAPSCAFCGSIMQVEQPLDPVEEAELVVPFAIDRQTAHDALRRWLRSLGWFRPGDLSSAATVESLRPLHWAAWIFDADAHVTWTADSDAGSRRSAWAPHAGATTFTWRSIVVSASRGLTGEETGRLVPGYRLDSAVPVGAPGAAAAAAGVEDDALESFDTQRSAARRKIVDTIEAIAARQLTDHGHVPGSRFRNVKTSVLLSRLHTRRYVLPSWVLAYRYKGTLYRSIVHGQDDSITFGQAPLSWAKILLVAALALGVVGLVLALAAG